jgi:hypothetical protein
MQHDLFVISVAAALIGAVVWVSRSPVAGKWFGPFPGETELRSSYFRRKALFALRCLAAVVIAAAVVCAAVFVVPEVRGSQALIFVALLFTLFGGMAILGAVLSALASLKAAVFGPNPVLRIQWEEAHLEGEPEA